jgi:hypothetical protein
VGIDHSTCAISAGRPDDMELRGSLRELAHERRRFGYRRLGWLFSREGHAMNHKKLYLIYREEKVPSPGELGQLCNGVYKGVRVTFRARRRNSRL